MQDTIRNQVVDPRAGCKAGVQLDEGIGPECTLLELLVHVSPDAGILDLDKAADIAGIVADKPITKGKDIHSRLLAELCGEICRISGERNNSKASR